MNQYTLSKEYKFEGKGLHTGRYSHLCLKPAPADTGIVFVRTDMGENVFVHALASNVSSTARSTTLQEGDASVATVEHILSALTGLGVDNAYIEIDNIEVPILDGSSRLYCEAIKADGTVAQDAGRKFLELDYEIEVRDEKSGSYVKITPSDKLEYHITVDFNSRVLGVQEASWAPGEEYASEIGVCRTFVFFHEIEFLFNQNLVKGGDVENAIVIVEHPATGEQVDRLAKLFNVGSLAVTDSGYLNNLELHFPNECGRHKLLDLIGDIRLAGGYLKARIEAYKPGHSINTKAARAAMDALKAE